MRSGRGRNRRSPAPAATPSAADQIGTMPRSICDRSRSNGCQANKPRRIAVNFRARAARPPVRLRQVRRYHAQYMVSRPEGARITWQKLSKTVVIGRTASNGRLERAAAKKGGSSWKRSSSGKFVTGLLVSGTVFAKAKPLTSLSTAEPRQLAHKSRKINREDDDQRRPKGGSVFASPRLTL